MIELRYLIESGVKRLQYRAMQTLMDIPQGWGDWQDVPEVQSEVSGG